MIYPNTIILYVDSPAISAAFYADLLGQQPSESSPTFALFVLDNPMKLGLWAKHTVEPMADVTGGGGELAFSVDNARVVDELYARWKHKKLTIAQLPTKMDFGYTFVALDPDGHRLRVYSLHQS
ncbi:VOC family protein [Legionella oakridgensis]|uniref:Lactoylglutathione lyase-related lyase n=2 Tax=Legionella oakridgensis TaxID=29423 RepID=W0B7X8_9GAMM|nr:VOC family protein [Legionella oakridgensis]AHE66648.1 lactoylglutathione lyase-related lyase [Legionella oakridgensis ATCC 33761 = DSM 21215]ETO93615.1 lactoylglutathione lyase [Legionella oakridgensis RV-2-2007]KTD37759.1 bleomycin resistance protein [Legionella oakridgensis]STY19789.1 bleomycin resistance protein [Legionella longbeachae]